MMTLVNNIIEMLKKDKNLQTGEAPKGLCPNCWGRSEYGGKFYQAVKNEGIDINTDDEHVGWVEEYANKYLNEISLQPIGVYHECNKCKLRYEKVD